MRPFWLRFALIAAAGVGGVGAVRAATESTWLEVPRSRIVVLTDMGNEADDSQTMVRLLVHNNRFDVAGLIAVSSCHQYAGKNDADPIRNDVQPTMITARIRAYAAVLPNLRRHADGWASAEELLAVVGAGPAAYGMSGVGPGRSTSGSALIAAALTDGDPRPLYVCINAGANCLAQALVDLRTRLDDTAFAAALGRLRIYDDAGQDDAGAWIAHTYPSIHYLRSRQQVFNFMNNDGPVTWDPAAAYPGQGQHAWAKTHVMTGHGPLGALYPRREKYRQPEIDHTLEGGGTSTWIGHANPGLTVPEQPTWGGWGGRFASTPVRNLRADQLRWADLVETEEAYFPFDMVPEAPDRWTDPVTDRTYEGLGVPIFRWRRAYQHEFAARMDWCVAAFDEANHHPVAALNGDTSDRILRLRTAPGTTLTLDAAASTDPDSHPLTFRWTFYPEAGTYAGALPQTLGTDSALAFRIPADAAGRQLHLILEVTDQHPDTPLTDYRRIVINVTP